MNISFFVTEDLIYENPLTKKIVPNDFEFEVMRYFRNFNLNQSVHKVFYNYGSNNWDEVMLYIMFKTKSLKTLIVSSKSNIEFNIKQHLLGNYIYPSETKNNNKIHVDLLITDIPIETLEKLQYKIISRKKFEIRPASALNYSSPESLNRININPEFLPTNYNMLDDKEVYDKVFKEYITIHDIKYNTKIMIINRTITGIIYSAINLSIISRRDVYVCIGFDYIYKIIYNDLPDYYFEIEEVESDLNWDLDELKDCAVKIPINELLIDLINNRVFSIVGSKEVLSQCYFDYDYCVISYLDNISYLKRKHSGTIFYNKPINVEIDDNTSEEEYEDEDITVEIYEDDEEDEDEIGEYIDTN